eukprot:3758770-Amphidinium_carterae.1
MCSIPAIWCGFLHDAANEHVGRRPVVFAYLGLPILQYVPRSPRDTKSHRTARKAIDPKRGKPIRTR